jgi:hypothetical protein
LNRLLFGVAAAKIAVTICKPSYDLLNSLLQGHEALQRAIEVPEDVDAFDDIATAFLDEQLLTAVQMVNMDLEQETRQVVLVGCGLDTRPYRQVSLSISLTLSSHARTPLQICLHMQQYCHPFHSHAFELLNMTALNLQASMA